MKGGLLSGKRRLSPRTNLEKARRTKWSTRPSTRPARRCWIHQRPTRPFCELLGRIGRICRDDFCQAFITAEAVGASTSRPRGSRLAVEDARAGRPRQRNGRGCIDDHRWPRDGEGALSEFGVTERAKFNAGPSTPERVAVALLRPRKPILAQADADGSYRAAQLDLRARCGCREVEDVDVFHAATAADVGNMPLRERSIRGRE